MTCLLVLVTSSTRAIDETTPASPLPDKPFAGALQTWNDRPQELMEAVRRDVDLAVRGHLDQTERQRFSIGDTAGPLAAPKWETSSFGLAETLAAWENIQQIQHPQVERWEDYFSEAGSSRLRLSFDRLAPFRERAEEIFARRGLPHDLIVVAFVESEFLPNAISPKGATGPWQFMPATATRYGLRQNTWTDERIDFEKSTMAAARYLADLYRLFGDWLLTLAAYNAGEDRILDALQMGETRDFWTLREQGLVPQETQDYVPKVLGALRAWRRIAPDAPEANSSIGVESHSPERQNWVYALTSSR